MLLGGETADVTRRSSLAQAHLVCVSWAVPCGVSLCGLGWLRMDLEDPGGGTIPELRSQVFLDGGSGCLKRHHGLTRRLKVSKPGLRRLTIGSALRAALKGAIGAFG